MKLGSVERPLHSSEPMKVARAIIENEFVTPAGRPGLWFARGTFWVWQGGRWQRKERGELERAAMRWMEDMNVQISDNSTERLGPGRGDAEQVVWAMESLREIPLKSMPIWTEAATERPHAGFCVALEDVVWSAEGYLERRDETWFDHVVLPCTLQQALTGKRERWERAVAEWGNGDPEWGKLLQRWMGYCLLTGREYRKWMLLQGVTAGGKGTINHVLKAMLGEGMVIMDLDTLVNDYGLAGVEHARVLSINEVSSLDRVGRGRGSKVVKSLVGQDPISINEKFEKIQKGVICNAAVMMSSNQVPDLGNEGAGMSAKMLVLPVTVGFDEKGAEVGLKERLVREELPGIIGWAMKGAEELVKARQEARWPRPAKAEDVERTYRVANNPMDAFLESCFIKDNTGYVRSEVVKREWREFCRENRLKNRVPDNQLLMRLEQEGSWQVERTRMRTDDGYVRVLKGVSLKKMRDSDL